MSRSYKDSPYCKESSASRHRCHRPKFMKRQANKRVRKTEDIANGGAYKKLFSSWDICDYAWRETRQEAIDKYNHADEYMLERFPTLQDYINFWEKYYYRK